MKVMNDHEIMRSAMKGRNVTQTVLAERIGKTQTNLSACMNRSRTSVDVLYEVMDALGYDIMMVDRETGVKAYKLEL